jgi:hypothetical protein
VVYLDSHDKTGESINLKKQLKKIRIFNLERRKCGSRHFPGFED